LQRFALLLICAVTLAGASQCSAQILHKKKPIDKSTDASNTAEPDKQLYDKAMADIKHGRHEMGRLSLQTLINTYPDSEYLAKAKLAIADSYFKEGGTANITQAINGYKDFIVFFPFMPEAAYAQMQVAMANYNEMPKADRDTTHTRAAEEEFQTFLLKYPKDPLAPQAEQRLREVQEVLAEGQYRVAYYYYVKGDRRAAAGRLIPLVARYPLYSKADSSLWMLGQIFEKSERKDIAGNYYAQIVKNYPLSPHAGDAKGKLKEFGVPIPQADPKAVSWMTAEQNAPRTHESLVHKPLGLLHSGPDVRMAAQTGAPILEPESDEPGTDILRGGNHSNLGGSTGNAAVVKVVTPGEPTPAGENTNSPAAEDVSSSSSTDSATGANGTAKTESPAAGSGTAPADGAVPAEGAAGTSTSETGSTSTDSSKTDNTQPATANTDQSDNKKESSSKKKGLRKLLPW
jgi:outer membrane protein assembly factor BamD